MDEDSSKIVKSGGKRRPPAAGLGRRKGSRNKIPASVKEMILSALEGVGGQEYLEEQARKNPQAFLSLLARLLPTEAKLDLDAEIGPPRGGVIAIPAQFKSVEEWRRAFAPKDTPAPDPAS